jgi:hypothetical protein
MRVLVVVRHPEDAFAVVRREMRRREEGGCRVVFLGTFEELARVAWRRHVERELGGELSRRLARILALRPLWRCLGRRGVAFVECW